MGTVTCELEASYAATAGAAPLHDRQGGLVAVAGGGTLGGYLYARARLLLRRRRANVVGGGGRMQVFVRTLGGRSLALDVSPSDTVDAVKARVQAKGRVPAREQRLLFDGRHLDDGRRTLAQYGVRKEANLFLQLRLRGGAGGDDGVPAGGEQYCWATAVGLLAAVVAVAAAVACFFPAAAAGSSGGLDLAALLFLWGLAVAGVNLITAGVSQTGGGEAWSFAAQSVLRKTAALARQNIAVLAPCAASSTATAIFLSGANPVLCFAFYVLHLVAMSLTLSLVFPEDGGRLELAGYGVRKGHLLLRLATAGTGSSHWATAVGLLAVSVAVATGLHFFPGGAAAGTGGLGAVMFLLLWALAVGGMNLINAGVFLTDRAESPSSCSVQAVLRKAAACARQNLGVLGVAAASSAATATTVSAAGPVVHFVCFAVHLVAVSLVTISVANPGRSPVSTGL